MYLEWLRPEKLLQQVHDENQRVFIEGGAQGRNVQKHLRTDVKENSSNEFNMIRTETTEAQFGIPSVALADV